MSVFPIYSLHSPLRFFSPFSHIARVNLVFHFSPLSFIFFLLHVFLLPNIMHFLATSLYSSLRFHTVFNYVFVFFFSLIHSTFPRVLAPSLSHAPHLTTSWPFRPSSLQRVFSPFTFLYSTHGAPNSSFTQSHHSLHLFLPLYSHTPPHLFPPFLLPHQPLTPHIFRTGIPIPVINNALLYIYIVFIWREDYLAWENRRLSSRA